MLYLLLCVPRILPSQMSFQSLYHIQRSLSEVHYVLVLLEHSCVQVILTFLQILSHSHVLIIILLLRLLNQNVHWGVL